MTPRPATGIGGSDGRRRRDYDPDMSANLPGEDEVADAIDPADVHALRLLQGALTVGPLLFLGVTLGLPMAAPPGAQPPPQAFQAAHAAMTLGAWGAALTVPAGRFRAFARRVREAPPADAAAAAGAWTVEVRAARILTLALLEGAALFGVVVVFLHRAAGVEPAARPDLWGALAPLLALVVYSAATWPSKRSLAIGWRRHVLESA